MQVKVVTSLMEEKKDLTSVTKEQSLGLSVCILAPEVIAPF